MSKGRGGLPPESGPKWRRDHLAGATSSPHRSIDTMDVVVLVDDQRFWFEYTSDRVDAHDLTNIGGPKCREKR